MCSEESMLMHLATSIIQELLALHNSDEGMGEVVVIPSAATWHEQIWQ